MGDIIQFPRPIPSQSQTEEGVARLRRIQEALSRINNLLERINHDSESRERRLREWKENGYWD